MDLNVEIIPGEGMLDLDVSISNVELSVDVIIGSSYGGTTEELPEVFITDAAPTEHSAKIWIAGEPSIVGESNLYNWYAVADPRGIAPIGWHVPSISEWKTLYDYVDDATGLSLREVGYDHWLANQGPIDFEQGTDIYGFKAIANGTYYRGEFGAIKYYSLYWSTSESITNDNRIDAAIISADSIFGFTYAKKEPAITIRLIRDSDNTAQIATDYDGNAYQSITIGTRTWLQKDLNVTHYLNGDLIGSNFNGVDGAFIKYSESGQSSLKYRKNSNWIELHDSQKEDKGVVADLISKMPLSLPEIQVSKESPTDLNVTMWIQQVEEQ